MTSITESSLDDSLRPAKLFAQRFTMSNENRDVKLAMAQERRLRRDQKIEQQLEMSQCKARYYK